jgi:nucleotidyltransferase substrate binding protein (TIGR01987 family)
MKASEISLKPLKDALSQLRKALAQPENEFIRDAVIQRFEFTFELSWKCMQRFIESDRPLGDTSTRNIFREAHVQGILSAVEPWFEFQKFRNLTSHVYSEKVSKEIYEKVKLFPAHCDDLLNALEKRKKS